MSISKQTNTNISIGVRSRHKTGAQIAEVPPALIILFFFSLFPALNLLYLCFAFGCGWYLNNIELREVACHTSSSLGLPFPPNGIYTEVSTATTGVGLPESQKWNGLMGVTEIPPSPEVAQFPLPNNPNSVGKSQVRTTVSIKPFMIMPFFAKFPILSQIPGLGQPVIFTYYGTIQQEEQGP